MNRKRLGVLVSGSGTNLQALLDACASKDYPAQVAVVLSNNPAAFALQRAQRAGVPAAVVDPGEFADREGFERRAAAVLGEHRVDLVCLAGFMRLLGKTFLSAFPMKILNIHPALLPAFPGLHAPAQALAHGVKITGCTVHWVDDGTDTGPIVAQAAVPVLPGDDEAALSARIQAEEHRLYPFAVQLVARGAFSRQGRVVKVEGAPVAGPLSLRNPGR